MSIATERAALFGQGLDIVPRERWGARQSYLSSRPVVSPAKWLFLHIAVIEPSGDEARDMRTIEAIGQSRFGIGCSYNAAAFRSGRLYEAQPLGRRGAHTVNDLPNPAFPSGSLNHLARALVLPQNVGHEVTDQQIDAAARWGAALIRAGFAVPGARWFGHRDVTRKSCPGEIGYRRLDELNRLTRHYEANGLTEDTMTPEQEKKVDRVLELLERQLPWPPERIDRAGRRHPPKTPNTVVADPKDRWIIEIHHGVQALLARGVADLDEAALAALIVEGMSDELAGAVADVLAERLAS